MIVDEAKQKVALFLKEMFQEANYGIGGNATFPNANDLDVPVLETKIDTSNTVSDDTTIDFSVSFSGASTNGNTIRELGIFSSTMPQDNQFDELRTTTSYSAESVMLSRINFDALGPFTANDTIDFTLTMVVE